MDNVVGGERFIIEGQVKAVGREIGINGTKIANDPKLEGQHEREDGQNVGIIR